MKSKRKVAGVCEECGGLPLLFGQARKTCGHDNVISFNADISNVLSAGLTPLQFNTDLFNTLASQQLAHGWRCHNC
eukprot:12124545-Karenia_brevis.AAC.1